MAYLEDIKPWSADHQVIRLNLVEGTLLSALSSGESSTTHLKRLEISDGLSLVLVSTEPVFINDQSTIRRQQELLQLISESKSPRLAFAFDRPLYCSALTEQCTQTAAALRHLYESYIPSGSLVVSGYSDAYERTFPKRD